MQRKQGNSAYRETRKHEETYAWNKESFEMKMKRKLGRTSH